MLRGDDPPPSQLPCTHRQLSGVNDAGKLPFCAFNGIKLPYFRQSVNRFFRFAGALPGFILDGVGKTVYNNKNAF